MRFIFKFIFCISKNHNSNAVATGLFPVQEVRAYFEEKKFCYLTFSKMGHYSGVTSKAFQNSENVGQKLGNAWASFVVHN